MGQKYFRWETEFLKAKSFYMVMPEADGLHRAGP